jgi:hypothetical protein
VKDTEQLRGQPSKIKIIRVECLDENVFLYLDQPWRDRQFLKSVYLLSPNADGIIELSLPDTSAQKQIYDCFGTGDLFVSEKGAITIANKKPMFVRALNSPSKLALITKRFY